MKLVTLIREKNSLRYLPRLINQVRSISDLTIVLDDHSTDGSNEWLLKLSKETENLLVLQQAQNTFDGGRDWNILYEFAGRYNPDWILSPDSDELLEEATAFQIRKLIESSGRDVRGWAFPFYYLWGDDKHYRNQGKYHNTKVIRLFRYEPTMRPPKRTSHTYGIPDEIDRRLIRVAPIRMWHYGYMLSEDRKTKYEFYTNRDKDPLAAGSGGTDYNHIAEENPADIVEVPSLEDWATHSVPRFGNFLDSRPYRMVIGAEFPTAHKFELHHLEKMPTDSADELRISYIFDGLPITELKPALQQAKRVLREGGRLEIIAVDYSTICQEFIQGNKERKIELTGRFLETPLRVPYKTLYYEELITNAMHDEGFEDWQRIPLPEFPFRLYCMCHKPGLNKWG